MPNIMFDYETIIKEGKPSGFNITVQNDYEICNKLEIRTISNLSSSKLAKKLRRKYGITLSHGCYPQINRDRLYIKGIYNETESRNSVGINEKHFALLKDFKKALNYTAKLKVVQ